MHIEILTAMFDRVTLPTAVRNELADPNTPTVVRDWIAAPPVWIEVRNARSILTDAAIAELGPGHRMPDLLQ